MERRSPERVDDAETEDVVSLKCASQVTSFLVVVVVVVFTLIKDASVILTILFLLLFFLKDDA